MDGTVREWDSARGGDRRQPPSHRALICPDKVTITVNRNGRSTTESVTLGSTQD